MRSVSSSSSSWVRSTRTSASMRPLCVSSVASRPRPGSSAAMSFDSTESRNSVAPGPLSASLPSCERSSNATPSVAARYPGSTVATVTRRAYKTGFRGRRGARVGFAPMPLADAFSQIVDSLPGDWTDLELDLRIADETRYVDAAVFLVVANAQPYSKHDWHWRLLVAHRFGHAAAVEAVHMALGLLDDAGIAGELALREAREGGARGGPRGAPPRSWRDELPQINPQ